MIQIYGKEQCSFCDAAKKFLDNRGVAYDYKQLNVDFTREELVEAAPAARSFPAIFINGAYIGGYQELMTKIGLIESMSGGQETLLG